MLGDAYETILTIYRFSPYVAGYEAGYEDILRSGVELLDSYLPHNENPDFCHGYLEGCRDGLFERRSYS